MSSEIYEFIISKLTSQSLTRRNIDLRVDEVLTELENNHLSKLLTLSLYKNSQYLSNQTLKALILLCGFEKRIEFKGRYSLFNNLWPTAINGNDSIEIYVEAGIFIKPSDLNLSSIQEHKLSAQRLIKGLSNRILFNSSSLSFNLDEILKITAGKPVSADNNFQDEIEPSSNFRIIQGSDDSISYTYDIDAILGPANFETVSSIFDGKSIDIDFNLLNRQKLHAKTEMAMCSMGIYKIMEYFNIKIGSITTSAGIIHLYYVCPQYPFMTDSEFSSVQDYLKAMWAYLKNETHINALSNIRDFTKFKFSILCTEVKTIFDKIKEFAMTRNKHHFDFLFIELYGCKNNLRKSSHDPVHSLYDKLNHILDLQHAPFIKIDVAVEVTVSPYNLVFMTEEFFRGLSNKSDYSLFFNENLKNVNSSTFSLNSKTIQGSSVTNITTNNMSIFKINCYNTCEDILQDVKKLSYLPLYSLSLLKSRFHGFSLAEAEHTSAKKLIKVSKIVDDLGDGKNQTFPYRIEIRIFPFLLTDAIDSIKQAIRQARLVVYESRSFFTTVHETACDMFKEIDPGSDVVSLNSIYHTMVYEYFLIHGFFKGSKNLHLLPKAFNNELNRIRYKSYEVRSIVLPRNTVSGLITESPMLLCLNRAVRDDYSISSAMKEKFYTIINSHSFNSSTVAEKIVSQYVSDLRECVDLSGIPGMGINVLNSSLYSIDVATRKINEYISIDKAIVINFAGPQYKKWNKMAFRCLIAHYVFETQVSILEVLTAIKRAFINQNLDLIYNLTSSIKRIFCKSFSPLSKLINITPNPIISVYIQDLSAISVLKRNALTELNLIVSTSIRFPRVRWEIDEEIRMIAGYKFYNAYSKSPHGVWSYLSESAIFGFLGTRTMQNLKEKFNRLRKSDEFMSLELRAESWNPQNVTAEEMNAHLGRFFHEETEEALYIQFTRVYEYDLELYKSRTIEVINVEEDESSSSAENLSKKDMLALIKALTLRVEVLENNNKLNSEPRRQIMELSNEKYDDIHDNDCYFDAYDIDNDFKASHNPLILDSSVKSIDKETESAVEYETMNTFSMNDTIDNNTVITDLSAVDTLTIATNLTKSFYKFDSINDSKLKSIYSKLINAYKGRTFLASEARKRIFSTQCRPSSEDFNCILELLVSKKKLQQVTRQKPFKYKCKSY